MTNTIDLTKDLEAWYDFSTDYFDSQRNVIQDKSGYGRHAKAIGGPTVGVEGPDSFEATGFDGTDDEFTLNKQLAFTEQTTAALVKPQLLDGSSQIIASNSFVGTGFLLRFTNDKVRFTLENDSGSAIGISGPLITEKEYIMVVASWDGETATLRENGDTVNKDQLTGQITSSVADFSIGRSLGSSTDYLDGDIAFVARWSRALSDAEIEALNRLTGPMGAQL